MRVEEEYVDVLQNMEYAIADTRRKYRNMSDYDVLRALEVLVDDYSGEKIGRAPRQARLSEVESALVENIRAMCEWRLGRIAAPGDESQPPEAKPQPLSVDEILLCLKRLIKSVKTWDKEGGMYGYLDFLAQFVV